MPWRLVRYGAKQQGNNEAETRTELIDPGMKEEVA